MFLEELSEIDESVFADQEHFAVELRTLMLEVLAAYLVARDLAAAANPTAVATVQAERESEASIAAVQPVAVTAELEMVTAMHFVLIAAASFVVACVWSAGLIACLA